MLSVVILIGGRKGWWWQRARTHAIYSFPHRAPDPRVEETELGRLVMEKTRFDHDA